MSYDLMSYDPLSYDQIFHAPPEVEASAPGRVNLLGEHTDYNDGFVLPIAIPQKTTLFVGFSGDRQHHVYSEQLQQLVSFSTADLVPQGFASYIFGCLRVLERQGDSVPPVNLYIRSSVPIGSGLSSSAALEVATLRGLRSLLKLDLDDLTLAHLGQQAEVEYAGVQCGIMDQMAASLADAEHLLFLDTRTGDRRRLALPEGAEILVIDSGIPRTLATSGYNQRRAECQEACRLLGVTALRDVQDPQQVEGLPDPLRRRARHVITENNRVLQAVAGVTAHQFGSLMNASHASLRDDYEVSIAGLDQLVAILQKTAGVFGARLTGAGFGGAAVALVEIGKARTIAQTVLSQYRQAGYTGRLLVPMEEEDLCYLPPTSDRHSQ
ncbi:MAG: galactokinase [Kovacikia sp.]